MVKDHVSLNGRDVVLVLVESGWSFVVVKSEE